MQGGTFRRIFTTRKIMRDSIPFRLELKQSFLAFDIPCQYSLPAHPDFIFSLFSFSLFIIIDNSKIHMFYRLCKDLSDKPYQR